VIARCDRCDRKAEKSGSLSRSGHRWDPAVAGLGKHVCSLCGGPLRAKRKGESESHIVSARVLLFDAVAVKHSGRRAGDVRREKARRSGEVILEVADEFAEAVR